MSDNAKKPRDNYPDVHTWLADLEHPDCRADAHGVCTGMHCTTCGIATYTGLAPCPNGCHDDWWPKAAA